MKRISMVAEFVILSAGLVLGQQPLNNEAVLKLVKAGIGDDTVVNMINTQSGNYSVGADDLVALKSGGASENH